MRKVKYTPKDIYDKFLTPGKVYDVISITKIKKAKYLKCYIENDIGYIRNFFFFNDCNNSWKDVTAEYRNDIIDAILL